MKVVAVVRDLMVFSRIESAARVAGVELARVDSPAQLPADADLVLVDWSARDSGWSDQLVAHSGRVVLFGPHTDLEAHAAAREAGLGPMWARSKFLSDVQRMLQDPA
jgi:hypothetical protein